MFCRNCGQEVPPDARFCTGCGGELEGNATPPISEPNAMDTPSKKKKARTRRGRLAGFLVGFAVATALFAAVLAIKMLWTDVRSDTNKPEEPGVGVLETEGATLEEPDLGGSDTEGTTLEGPGFETPEEAVLAFLEAMKERDMNGVLATFAMESYVENMDLEAYLESLGVYHYALPLPGEGDYVSAINLNLRQSDVTMDLFWQYITLVDPDSPILDGQAIPLRDCSAQELLDSLIQGDGTQTLASMEIGEFLKPESFSEHYSDEATQKNFAKRADYFGGEKVQSMVLEVTVNGRAYIFCPDVICYDGTWYLLNPGGVLAMLLGADQKYSGFIPMDEVS